MSLTLLLNGARGRMGRAIAAAAPEFGFVLGAALDLGDDLSSAMDGCDVVVDFSSPSATRALLEMAVARNKPVVIGTTGHDATEKKSLLGLAGRVPCVWSGNYSVGVNVLFGLVRRAARTLGADYDAEVVEMHHRLKQDAPSGTALRLLEILMEERKAGPEALRHGRHGMVGPRTPSEIGIHALRGGDVVGDHTVIFAALGERLELIHRASDRGIFARGALRAAVWVTRQTPGVYDMQDVLGLK